jgi:hypothetical protein
MKKFVFNVSTEDPATSNVILVEVLDEKLCDPPKLFAWFIQDAIEKFMDGPCKVDAYWEGG